MRYFTWVVFCLYAAICIGCGGDGLNRVEIEGLVKAQNGPIKNASVQFIPQAGTPGEGALGLADDQGKFTVISSRDQDGGLPAGKYRVRVNQMIDGDGTVLPAEATQAEHPFSKEGVPTPFSTPESTLEVNVPETGGQITIDVPVKTKGK